MEIRKIDPTEKAQELFNIENAAFNREFDLKSRSVQEEIDYLINSEVYMAYEEDIAVGFIAYETKQDFSELMSLAVTPEFQNKGIGKKMLHEILHKLKGKEVRLVTHPKNTSAIILYLKCGFTISGWKDNYYGDGQARLILTSSYH